jgi:hypothetical protein
VFRDQVDNDYGWALMVRNRLGRFRGVHLDIIYIFNCVLMANDD